MIFEDVLHLEGSRSPWLRCGFMLSFDMLSFLDWMVDIMSWCILDSSLEFWHDMVILICSYGACYLFG